MTTVSEPLFVDYNLKFIIFSVITNIYNTKTYLNGIVHSHRKTEKVFFDN
jgi:hypothetical protein